MEIIENYGADAFRYYFTRHVPTFDDGDFTWEKFENAYNGELANDLGNLVSRVAQMMKKYEISRDKLPSLSFADLIGESVPDYTQAFSNLDFTRALDIAWDFVQSRNQFIEENQPWALAKTDRAKLESVMNILARDLLTAAELLNPFLPDTSAKIRKIFAGEILPNEIPILFPKKYLHTEEPARK
jgi:methionyl-tRNA synthetase